MKRRWVYHDGLPRRHVPERGEIYAKQSGHLFLDFDFEVYLTHICTSTYASRYLLTRADVRTLCVSSRAKDDSSAAINARASRR